VCDLSGGSLSFYLPARLSFGVQNQAALGGKETLVMVPQLMTK